ncbi:hypothetical protein FRB95_005363 [Tulasnella sp. JGI-2019a]|nr:hypothetical protein FRB95_005363 [Tulasnella sp. JGI-2019a]
MSSMPGSQAYSYVEREQHTHVADCVLLILFAQYFAYILFQIPGTSGPKLIPANLWIGGVAVVWGTAAASQAVIQSYKGIMIARFILGMGEAGFGAAIPLIFSFWYTKREIGFRLSIFIGSAAAAGVFGGLLAYCIQNINSTGIESWRVLFFVESVPVILAGFFCCFILPDRPATTRWLNEDERQLALSRLARESSQEVHGSSLNWRHAVMAISDRRLAMCYAIYMGVNIALASLGNFLPAIVAGMGYTGASAQIMTVPPYSVAFVVMTFVNYTSDRSGRRGLFVAFFMMIGALGYLILLFVHHNDHIRYSAIFLVTSGTYTTIPLMLSWVTANAGSETQKVIGLAGLNTFGQTFAILAAHVYPKSAAPYYTLGYGLSCGSQLIASILALALVRTWGQENSRRDRVYGKPPSDAIVNTAEFGDRAPNFRYML